MDKTSRLHGLDTLRAIAITLVFMYHDMAFVSGEPTFGFASVIGWVGVDLFFVLSGYLIANQIFSGIARGGRISLKRFYLRRALRTWPAFWVVLAVYFIFPSEVGGETLLPLWRYLTFTQNFGLHGGTSFSWALMFILLGIGIASRTVLWFSHGESKGGYHPYIYYATLCRFDEFLPGIAIATIKNFYPSAWRALTQRGNAVLSLGLVVTAVMLALVDRLFLIPGYGYGLFMTSVGFSMLAMAFGILVVAALSPSSWLHWVRVPGAYHVALWSYSIYLSHKAVALVVGTQRARWELAPGLKPLVIAIACAAAGWLLFRLIEAPTMALRDRLFPTSYGDLEKRVT